VLGAAGIGRDPASREGGAADEAAGGAVLVVGGVVVGGVVVGGVGVGGAEVGGGVGAGQGGGGGAKVSKVFWASLRASCARRSS
jgi:hypothetical protein